MDADVAFACLVAVVVFGGGTALVIWAVVTLRRTARRTAATEARLARLEREVAALRAGAASGPAGYAPSPAAAPASERGRRAAWVAAGEPTPSEPSAPAGSAGTSTSGPSTHAPGEAAAPGEAPAPGGEPARGDVQAAFEAAGDAQAPGDRPVPADRAPSPSVPPPSSPLLPGFSPQPADPASRLPDSRPAAAPTVAPEPVGGAGATASGATASRAVGPSATAASDAAPAAPAPRRVGLEERLGARLPVWLGAVALALAGAFLVKYSVDQGWIGPTVRVSLASAFGLALVAGGQLLRRAARPIAGALAAAGVAVLYAAVLAAVHLYHLLPDAAGFALMTLVTASAIGLALVHGPIIAVVGLVGGFLTPALIHLGEPDPKRLFAYLLLLHAAVVTVSRRRSWPALSAASLAGGFLWVVAFLNGGFETGDGRWLQLFLLVSVAGWAAARLAGDAGRSADGRAAGSRLPVWSAATASLVVFAVITWREAFGPVEWGLLACLVAGLLVVDRFVAGFDDLSWLAAAMIAVLLTGWAVLLAERPGDLPRFVLTATGMTVLLAGGSWAALWGARRPGRWASLAAAAGFVLPVVVWWGWRAAVPDAEPAVPWSLVALALAALFVLALLPVARRRGLAAAAEPSVEGGLSAALAALAVAATAHLTWAAALGFEREVLTVALALEVPALAWLARRFRLPVLLRLAALLAVGASLRLLLNPWLVDAIAGQPRLLNTVLWTFGCALAAFVAAVAALVAGRAAEVPAAASHRGEAAALAALLRWACLALLLALVTWEVLHAFAPAESPLAARHGLLDVGALAVAWIAVGLAVLVAARRWPAALATAGTVGSRLVLLLGLAAVLLGPMLAFNPVWSGDAVGARPLLNHLLWIYGLPALLLAFGARLAPRRPGGATDRAFAAALTAGALLLLFVLVTLEVLQGFRGAVLDRPSPHPYAEGWALSISWLLLGTALLVAGIVARHRLLRAAALAVTGIAVIKVFLFDVARLGDLYRVLSFLGLGLSLLLLAWLYQRFVFRSGDGSAPPPPAA